MQAKSTVQYLLVAPTRVKSRGRFTCSGTSKDACVRARPRGYPKFHLLFIIRTSGPNRHGVDWCKSSRQSSERSQRSQLIQSMRSQALIRLLLRRRPHSISARTSMLLLHTCYTKLHHTATTPGRPITGRTSTSTKSQTYGIWF